MLRYVLRRLLHAIAVMFLMSLFVFLLIRLVPGNPAELIAGYGASQEQIDRISRNLGLSGPVIGQFFTWLGRLLHGNLGTSFISGLPVTTLIGQRWFATFQIAFAASIISPFLAILAGSLAVRRRRSITGRVSDVTSGVLIALPGFWLGILGIVVFSIDLGWLPAGGYASLTADPLQSLRAMVLPTLALALTGAAVLYRFVKTSMLSALVDTHVSGAVSRGVPEGRLFRRHVLRNALIPVVTIYGVHFGYTLAGAVVIEQVFAWPGLGTLIVEAVRQRDYVLVQGCILVLAATFLLVNLLTDIAYGVLDPRIRVAVEGD